MEKRHHMGIKIPDFEEALKNPILDIAARVWDDERYEAFKVCYRSMRAVDDLVDKRKAEGKIGTGERGKMEQAINEWAEGGALEPAIRGKLADAMRKFRLPMWPWKRLSRAMIYDVNNEGFESFPDFLEYSEGAAVAPASIFMHLCAVERDGKGYSPPKFDVVEAARPIALFCYLVHIIRDFQKDQKENLNYFAGSLLRENGITPRMLRKAAQGKGIHPGLRKMMAHYVGLARKYQKEARDALNRVAAHLGPKYLLSLEILYGLYSQIFERIDVEGGRFTTEELNPSPLEIKERIAKVAFSFAASRNSARATARV